jgi:hypothetical protein
LNEAITDQRSGQKGSLQFRPGRPGLHFPVGGGRFKGPIGQGLQDVVAENMGRLLLHDMQNLYPNLRISTSVKRLAHLEEVARARLLALTKTLVAVALARTLRAAWRAGLRPWVWSGSSLEASCTFSASRMWAWWL